MICVHPLSGVVQPSEFDLETGRLCVMASRHQVGLIIVTRDHVETTLEELAPSAGTGGGMPDLMGAGHRATPSSGWTWSDEGRSSRPLRERAAVANV